MTLPLWLIVIFPTLIGFLACQCYRQWRQLREYRGLMSAATKELRECERLIGEASRAIKNQGSAKLLKEGQI